LLALLGSFTAFGLSLSEQLHKLIVAVTLCVLDIGLQAQRIAETPLGKPDEVVVLSLVPVRCPVSVLLDIVRRSFTSGP
jgi:hypothetical protein